MTPLRPLLRLAVAAAASLTLATPALAAIAYDESISGDLSDNRLAPTSIGNLVVGANDLLGTTGIQEDDLGDEFRDYGTFVVLANTVLTSITVLPGTEGAEGGQAQLLFFGLQAGEIITVSPIAMNPNAGAVLVGWDHFNQDLPVDHNLLVGKFPIGAGTYSFWIQDFDEGPAHYGLRFNVTAVPVPEPQTYALMLAGLGLVGVMARRRMALVRNDA